jgi:hypothetical protein
MPTTPRRTLTVYGDESGDLFHFPHFLLGIVMTYAPDVHSRAIDALRVKHDYPRQFEYKKTDRLKVGLCKDVIDYFVAQPDLEFQAMRIRCADHDLRHFEGDFDSSGRQPQVTAYNYRYKQVISHNTSPRDDLVIMLDARSRAKGDNLPEYLKAQIENVKDVQLVDSARHNLIQLADLLTGSVFGELTNATHPVKLGLIQHLRSRLNVMRLSDDRPLRLSRKFRVYKWTAPKT